MSTPVQSTPPRRHLPPAARERAPSAELRVQMQRMIDLQYETQHYVQQEQAQEDERGFPIPTSVTTTTTTTTSETLRATSESASSPAATGNPTSSNTPHHSLASPEMRNLSAASGVGTGTLYFGKVDPDVRSPMHNGVSEGTGLKKSAQHLNFGYGGTDMGEGPLLEGNNPNNLALLPREEHDFHYGNPDYHDPFDSEEEELKHHSSFCCLWDMLVECLWVLWEHESLHRSFCYGAIDGMLTGSGIVATFCGMELLSSSSSHEIRALVVVFTAATCFADSICMGLGHIWTTHLLASAQVRDRADARQQLQASKAEAKGQLVDMLLAKGMLKIDAMSLADTLEGYPDLFVSALLGDSVSGGSPHAGAGDLSRSSSSQRGFSQFTNDPFDFDPEARAVRDATSESRQEALFMMAGFSFFAVVPSLIFLAAPIAKSAAVAQASMNPTSMVVSLIAALMWCLGVWKSRFMDSNWFLFGVETVVVLFCCMLAAFGLGALISHWILPDYVLSVVPASHVTSTVYSSDL